MIVRRLLKYKKIISVILYYPIANASIAFILGIICSEILRLNLAVNSVLIFSLILIAARIEKISHKMIVIFIIFFALGINRYSGFYIKHPNDIYNYINQEVILEGNVKGQPDLGTNLKAVIQIESLNDNSSTGNIIINFNRYPELKESDRVKLKVKVEMPENFDGFNYIEYLRTENIFTVGKFPQIIEVKSGGNSIYNNIINLRYSIRDNVYKILPQPHANLSLGILIGYRAGMPKDFDQNLSTTGTTHIIAVSGFNVTILLTYIITFTKFIPRKVSLTIAGITLTLFMIIVGFDNIPALRATLLGYSLLLSQAIGRKGGLVSFLPLSAALIIFMNPLAFKSVSFQLSFFSTLGLVVLSETFSNKLSFIKFSFKEELATTLAAIYSTLPTILTTFGTLSLISPLVNIIVLPIIPLSMILSLISTITTFISLDLAMIMSYPVYFVLEIFIRIINFFGSLPFASINIDLAIHPVIIFLFSFISFIEIYIYSNE